MPLDRERVTAGSQRRELDTEQVVRVVSNGIDQSRAPNVLEHERVVHASAAETGDASGYIATESSVRRVTRTGARVRAAKVLGDEIPSAQLSSTVAGELELLHDRDFERVDNIQLTSCQRDQVAFEGLRVAQAPDDV